MTHTSPAPQSHSEEPVSGSSHLISIVTEFVAPASLTVALLFYFGWARAFSFYDFFGIPLSVLPFSQQELFIRSVDALYIPLGLACLVGLLLTWARSIDRNRVEAILPLFVLQGIYLIALAIPNHARARIKSTTKNIVVISFTVAAILLIVNAAAGLLDQPTPINQAMIAAAPLSLIVGVTVLSRLVRTMPSTSSNHSQPQMIRTVESVLLFVVIGLGAFWAVDDYAEAVGRARANQTATALRDRPQVVIHTDNPLRLAALGSPASGVRESVCAPPPGDKDLKTSYRYEGLVLLVQVGDQLVLVPRTWTPADGTAVVVPKGGSGATRFEFTMSIRDRSLPSASC
ncbi:hypothetical protein [Nocardia ignorata]|uniref:Uncharacterized protein n=1 Tax=Nocardia ignorata TaxID=145285 RepID=A0A4R6PTH6_NOCIG|nr:hypothetical protein [Nocardia ignorata]TDP42171.1 hypothetical protein DFR75_1011281 [Nocardia ignorata]